jgi:hypothetical protein
MIFSDEKVLGPPKGQGLFVKWLNGEMVKWLNGEMVKW